MFTVGQSSESATHRWLTSVEPFLQVLFSVQLYHRRRLVLPAPANIKSAEVMVILQTELWHRWRIGFGWNTVLMAPSSICCSYWLRARVVRTWGAVKMMHLLLLFVLVCNSASEHIAPVSPTDKDINHNNRDWYCLWEYERECAWDNNSEKNGC